MKTLKILIVSQNPLSSQRVSDIETGRRAMEKYAFGRLQVIFDYRVIPNFLEGVILESDDDIDENWLQAKVNDLQYHIVHLDMTPEEWDEIGLRSNLYGQSRVITIANGKQGVTYGRWNDSIGNRAHRELPFDIRKDITSVGLGVWHEVDHTLRNLFGIPSVHTHYYFYGYDRLPMSYKDVDTWNLKRYARKPDPNVGWANLDFSKLVSIEILFQLQTINLLQQIVILYGILFKKKQKNPSKYATELQPIVQEKVDMMIEAFDKVGMPIRMVEGVRTCERQNELYAQGRTKAGPIVTNARCGESLHQYGVAVDLIFRKEGYNASPEKWEILGKIGEELGFEWGGRWTSLVDKPHFQLTLGYSLSDFQDGNVDYSKYK